MSFSTAFGPHFLDFGLISTSILKAFSLLFEDAGNLEKWSPSHAKTRFGSFWGHIFSWFSAHVSRSILKSTFYHFVINLYCFWASILAPWGRLSNVCFSGLEKCPGFFFFCSWGGGIFDPSGRRGELGGTCKVSGMHLGNIWHLGGIWGVRGHRRPRGGFGGKIC